MNEKSSRNQRLYCPTPHCPNHALANPSTALESSQTRFLKWGRYKTLSFRHPLQRFKCRLCQTTFSQRMASVEYQNKKLGLSSKVFFSFVDGLSNRQIAGNLKVDESLVRLRIKKLSQQSLLYHSLKMRGKDILEPVAYDGVENFAKSQYEPNNINQAIGMESLFIYDFNFSPLNRKGRMSDRQKLRKEKLELSLGAFPRNAIRTSTKTLLLRLVAKTKEEKLTLLSDEHFQYRRVVEQDLPKLNIFIDHKTISSKASRTYRHILFSVNHADLLLRQHVKAFSRETISFSKTHEAMVEKYALFMAWKNYIRPQFTKVQKHNPKSNTQTPAQAAGVESKPLKFRDLFGTRRHPSQVELNSEWHNYHQGVVPNLRQKKAA